MRKNGYGQYLMQVLTGNVQSSLKFLQHSESLYRLLEGYPQHVP